MDSELNEQNQRIYDELLSKHILKMQNAYPPQPSILFIIPIESIVIPHPAWYTPIILNITLNDFRPLYSITLSQTEVNTEIEDYIDWLDDHIQLEVNILRSVVYINEVRTIFSSMSGFQRIIPGGIEGKKQLLTRIWEKLLSKNILSLSVEENIGEEWLIDLLVEFWSTSLRFSQSRLNDIELMLEKPRDVKRIIEALQVNYMIKTVKLETEERVGIEVEQLVEDFRSKRIGTEVRLNWKNKRFQIWDDRNVEIFYPNDE